MYLASSHPNPTSKLLLQARKYDQWYQERRKQEDLARFLRLASYSKPLHNQNFEPSAPSANIHLTHVQVHAEQTDNITVDPNYTCTDHPQNQEATAPHVNISSEVPEPVTEFVEPSECAHSEADSPTLESRVGTQFLNENWSFAETSEGQDNFETIDQQPGTSTPTSPTASYLPFSYPFCHTFNHAFQPSAYKPLIDLDTTRTLVMLDDETPTNDTLTNIESNFNNNVQSTDLEQDLYIEQDQLIEQEQEIDHPAHDPDLTIDNAEIGTQRMLRPRGSIKKPARYTD